MHVTDGVWAVRDVTGEGAFTHIVMYQSVIATADILGREAAPPDHRALSRVTFTDPEVGSVGLTEGEAKRRGVNHRTGSALVAHLGAGYTGPGTRDSSSWSRTETEPFWWARPQLGRAEARCSRCRISPSRRRYRCRRRGGSSTGTRPSTAVSRMPSATS